MPSIISVDDTMIFYLLHDSVTGDERHDTFFEHEKRIVGETSTTFFV